MGDPVEGISETEWGDAGETLPDPGLEKDYQAIADGAKSVIQEGSAAFAAGDYSTAQRFFLEAVMADERDGYAKLLHGMSSFAEGDFALAGLTVRRALLTSEVLIYQPPDLRTLYTDQEPFTAHLAALSAFVQAHPANLNAKFLLGYVYYATARPEIAAVLFSELTGADENDELAKKMYETASSVEKLIPG